MAANYNSDGEVQVFSMQVAIDDNCDFDTFEKHFIDYTEAWNWARNKANELQEFIEYNPGSNIKFDLDWDWMTFEEWEALKQKEENNELD